MATKSPKVGAVGIAEEPYLAKARKQGEELRQKGMQDLAEIKKAEEAVAGVEGEITQAKFEQEKARLAETEKAEAEYAGKERGLYEQSERQLEKYPFPTYKPTQEDATSYAQLGSMVVTLGMMLGGGAKMSGKAALASMTGMINGWREGRQDLWRREAQKFEKELQNIKAEREAIQKNLEKGLKLAATDRKAAQAAIDTAAHIAGQSVPGLLMKRGQLIPALNFMKSAAALSEKTEENILKNSTTQQQHEEQRKDAAAQRQAILQAARDKAKTPGRVGQNALTFASRVYGNILNASADLKNLTMLPKTAESPLLAGMINTEPATALGSIKAFVGRQMTSADARAFDQVTNSLDAALARLEAQGVASGATQGAIKAFNALKPKAGDPAVNMAMYIARVKQEIETGIRVHREMPGATENQKSEAIQELQKINKIIPFSVDDVLSVARGNRETLNDKMKNLVQKPLIAQGIKYQGLSPLDVDATQQTDKSDLRSKAAARIAAGGNPDAVARRYKELTGEDY
jgi:hypothetical protein